MECLGRLKKDDGSERQVFEGRKRERTENRETRFRCHSHWEESIGRWVEIWLGMHYKELDLGIRPNLDLT